MGPMLLQEETGVPEITGAPIFYSFKIRLLCINIQILRFLYEFGGDTKTFPGGMPPHASHSPPLKIN